MIEVMAALLLLALGLALSAFFSGSETGFYRIARVRLLIDAVGGDRVARGLLWATQRPSIFVATALVGNNLANYLITLSVVIGVQTLFPTASQAAEVAASLALTPLVFIYGELLPKYLFYEAPNRLLHRCAPGLAVAGICFAPVTAIVWLVNQAVAWLASTSPQEIRVELARRELGEVMTEGHEAGILLPWQQTLIHGILGLSGEAVKQFITPAGRYAFVTTAMSPREVVRVARRHGRNLLPVEDSSDRRRLVGYVRVSELVLQERALLAPIRPLVELGADETYLSAVTRLLAAGNALGRVSTSDRRTLGFITGRELTDAVFNRQ